MREVGPLEARSLEIEEVRASRKRLVLAADDDRRRIERDLHDGVQQRLVALAVNLQLARASVETDPEAARALLEEMGRDVRQALDETAQLAQRISPPLLEAGGLAVALRSAAVSVGVPAVVEVAAGTSQPLEIAWTVCLCWLEALERAHGDARLERAHGDARPVITIREDEGMLAFEIVEVRPHSEAGLERLRDRIEALDGRLTIRSEPGSVTRSSGALPLTG